MWLKSVALYIASRFGPVMIESNVLNRFIWVRKRAVKLWELFNLDGFCMIDLFCCEILCSVKMFEDKFVY